MRVLRTVSVGLGPIGRAAARLALDAASLELVAAVDIDPEKRGRELAELLELPAATGIRVETDLGAALARARPDCVLLCTASFLPQIRLDLLRAVAAGASVVSPCEELLLPDLRYPEIAEEIDRAAKAGGATVVGTGVNPGFVLDFLPVVASAACHEVRRVRGVRVVDAGTRRLPLQKKVGAGLPVDEFEELVRQERLGHVGMRQSVALVGRALGLELESVEQTVEPVVAARELTTPFLTVGPGRAAGIRNVGQGRRDGELLVELVLEMYVGAENPHDEILLEGDPDLRLLFEGGVPGDQATAAILVNTVRQVVEASPGLKTILDIPPPRLVR